MSVSLKDGRDAGARTISHVSAVLSSVAMDPDMEPAIARQIADSCRGLLEAGRSAVENCHTGTKSYALADAHVDGEYARSLHYLRIIDTVHRSAT